MDDVERNRDAKKENLEQLRGKQKDTIVKILNENKNFLIDFNDVMNTVTSDNDYPAFVALRFLNDFTDGFMV